MHTYYCLTCGQLKQGDMRRVEINVCEDCAPDDPEEDKLNPILTWMG